MTIDIYAILASKQHNEHHLKRYFKFILACVEKNKNLDNSVYTEAHHICPRAKDMFPEYEDYNNKFPWNKVKLVADQHHIAHRMLWKAYSWSSMAYTYKCFVDGYTSKNHKRHNIKITAKVYRKLKEDASKYSSELRKDTAIYYDINGLKIRCQCNDIRVLSGELKQKTKWIRNIFTNKLKRIFDHENIPNGWLEGTGKTWNKGIPISAETSKKISKGISGTKNPFYGLKHSEENLEKMRGPRVGNPLIAATKLFANKTKVFLHKHKESQIFECLTRASFNRKYSYVKNLRLFKREWEISAIDITEIIHSPSDYIRFIFINQVSHKK